MMNLRNPASLKAPAADALRRSGPEAKRIVLIYAGVVAAAALLLSSLNFVLEEQIGSTGGLSGMGTRAILSSVQSFLTVLQSVALPFWEMGYLYAAMRLARSQNTPDKTLLEGFRRFGPVLRLRLLMGALLMGIAALCVFPSYQIFSFTPAGYGLIQQMAPYALDTETLDAAMQSEPAVIAAMQAAIPVLTLIYGGLVLLIAVPVMYRFRMANCALLDAPEKGALAAMRTSRELMWHNRVALLRLDLRFWWYYLAQLLLMFIAYGDVLLSFLNITPPWSDTVSYFLFSITALVCQTLLYYFARNRIEVTYVMAYDSLLGTGSAAQSNPEA